MASTAADLILQHIRGLAAAEHTSHLHDSQLVQRFVEQRDEAAFAALVRRHGPLVLNTCRRVLHHEQDAEDVFQATFLVLARKAGSIGKHESVGSWLYYVAYHLAMRARRQAHHRRQREQCANVRQSPNPLEEITGRELLGVLDEELQQLPQHLQTPLILCYLQGQTRDKAAKILGCSLSTLQRRLEQGRERLRLRLERRGVALPAAFLVVGVSEAAAQAAVPALLAATTVRAALKAGAVSAQAAALAAGIAPSLAAGKFKVVAALVLTMGLLGAGSGWLVHKERLTPHVPRFTPHAPRPTPHAPRKPAEGPEKIAVAGRVLDYEDKPLAGAEVVILGVLQDRIGPPLGRVRLNEKVLARGKAGADGRFHLHVPDTLLYKYARLYALAGTAGHGLNWERIALKKPRTETVVHLPPEKIVRGRLLDVQGQPAVGVRVKVFRLLAAALGDVEKPWLNDLSKDGIPPWPSPAITDSKGRFVLKGLNPDMRLFLSLESDLFAPASVIIQSDRRNRLVQEINRVLAPAQIIEGVVTAADTGKPLSHAHLQLVAGQNPNARRAYGTVLAGQTDDKGHYRFNPPLSKLYTLVVTAPDGQPYLRRETTFRWPKAAVKHRLNLALARGVLVRGKVTEAGSGKPVGRR